MLKEIWLVKKAQQGDGEAFVQLTKQYEKILYGVARRYLKDEDVADVLQDTLLIAFKNIHSLKQPKYFNTWLTKILINECNKLLKKNKQYSYQTLEENADLAERTSVDTLELEELISELNPIYKTPILLYYYSGFSYKEISRIIDEPLGTVKSRISRGKALLQKEYRKGE
ncbi:sigma-70 family RNA polymerase sigma factor [Enterococcus sp. 669A]|uniref:Sigma-70 family RNA polymerase sigma factor n=1 Tax=Candidatus Enterococcus moelleringii TaxID=2815325 RepID=A0ABS3L816_9ENTE|nr:sigma-70 family RNA polymerase sigma factor [Enterococcus sp. 669A]MBO1305769.1 sigma-70 family RNA polymerase sigma factor [Enterococcus sp. 669A]